ncbi:hypothetical protein BDV23DRAFT_191691 [Aspergillus alliaceus]|uniref:NmrA-like domain-containing protein n=1 Tax=Petromyces alliaceus TaxID=209559 RepID=A0A5N7CIH2_PETAA|nr:hypothetical protein BDV23DRAFT_191691 [Aspergillus alliaceus]
MRDFVTGASGQQVYALVRTDKSSTAADLEERGAIVVEGTFDELLHRVCEEVSAVFLDVLPSPNNDTELRHARDVITAAHAPRKSIVTTIVYTSICDVDQRALSPGWSDWPQDSILKQYLASKAAIKDLVRTAGFQHWTIFRPPIFMTNFLLPGARAYFPTLPSPARDLRIATARGKRIMLIDTDDIGRLATAAILDSARLSPPFCGVLSGASGWDILVGYIPPAVAARLARVDP